MLSRGENKAMADARPGRVAGGAAWFTGRILPRLILRAVQRFVVPELRIYLIYETRPTPRTVRGPKTVVLISHHCSIYGISSTESK